MGTSARKKKKKKKKKNELKKLSVAVTEMEIVTVGNGKPSTSKIPPELLRLLKLR